MITNSEKEALRKCLSECPIQVGIDRRYFTKSDILSKIGDESAVDFNSFRQYLTTRTKAFCEECDEQFSSDHRQANRIQKTVYTIDPVGISESVLLSASKTGPLEEVETLSPINGCYRARCRFGENDLIFEFFSEKDELLQSTIDPFDLEFPVLLRNMDVPNHQRHRFRWEELISEQFVRNISSVISDVRSKTTAVFAEYEEPFIEDHRTEIKKAIRDYFSRSDYEVYTEVAEHCPELEKYGIEVETADYVCIKNGGKILVSHGSKRDGWYMQRFVSGELTSIEGETIFEDFHDQIDEKIRRYKRISGQLSSAPQFMRGLGGVIAVVSVVLAALNTNEIDELMQSVPVFSTYSSEATVLVILFNTLVLGIFVTMLVTPYIKEEFFSWKMYPCGAERNRFRIVRHSKYFLEE